MDPVQEVAIELLDTQVFSGSVKRGSDRWRFLGYRILKDCWLVNLVYKEVMSVMITIPEN